MRDSEQETSNDEEERERYTRRENQGCLSKSNWKHRFNQEFQIQSQNP